MRLLSMVTSAVVAAAALTATAQAGGSVAYIGLRGSIIQTDDGGTTSGPVDYTATYQDGFAAGAFLGWVLDDNFRFELEATYRNADLNALHIIRNDFDNSTEGQTFQTNGHAYAGAFMTNLYYDIHFLGDIGVLPWIGAGIGGAYIDYSVDQASLGFAAQDDTWAFAWQVMAGITVPLADGISGSVGYRYFQTQDFSYVDAFGVGFKTDLTQQSIDVGLQFHF